MEKNTKKQSITGRTQIKELPKAEKLLDKCHDIVYTSKCHDIVYSSLKAKVN